MNIKNKIMKRKTTYSPQDIKEQAAKVRKVWKANSEFRISDATFDDFEKVYVEFDATSKKIEAGLRELVELRKSRDKASVKLTELGTRARAGMRGYFGSESPQYTQIKAGWPKKAARSKKPESTNPD
jgi:hypothetical protein